MDAGSIVLNYVVPAFGSLLANFMYASNIPAVRLAIRLKSLGHTNIFPYAAMLLNALGWLEFMKLLLLFISLSSHTFSTYCEKHCTHLYFPNKVFGVYVQNPFVLISNVPGGILCLWYCIISYNLEADRKRADKFLHMVLGFIIYQVVVGMVAVFVPFYLPVYWLLNISSLLCNILAYGFLSFILNAPLTTMIEVIKTKTSRSIDPLLTVNIIISSALWVIYGIIINSLNIWLANALGFIFSVTLLLLLFIYPRNVKKIKNMKEIEEEKDNNNNNNNKENVMGVDIHVGEIESKSVTVCV